MNDADPAQLVADLVHLLDVTDLGRDRFEGRRKVGGIGRVYGGQVIGQALAAAERSVADDRPVHSLHAYFLRGGSEDHAIDFRVERDLDGGSFSNRRIIASQLGKPILTMMASFHQREDGVHHQDAMPQVPQPEDLAADEEQRRKFAAGVSEPLRTLILRPRPIEMRTVEAPQWMVGEPGPPLSNTWFRSAAPLPDDPKVHRAVLGYISDMPLLSTSTLPHGLNWTKGTMMGASLDHALWFHDDFRADEWLLYTTESPWAGRARGMNLGKIFTRDGRLVATAAQEGLIRKLAPK